MNAMTIRLTHVLLCLATCFPACIFAEEGAEDAAQDPDFAIQGEYVGEVTSGEKKQPLGIQVIARGEGEFGSLWYYGGLPGDGWDPREPLIQGSTVDQLTKFQQAGLTAQVIEGAIVVTNEKGVVLGTLKKVVRRSSTLNAKPPEKAVVLFDGSTADTFENGKLTEDKLLMPGATSKARLGSGTLHIEFFIPFDPKGASRGNSGCYLQSRYEVQILDSFGFAPHNHECGGIPGVKAADVNMTFPPGSWQTYDVDFTAPVFKDGQKVSDAIMTVRHNGVVTHQDVKVPGVTQSAPLEEGPDPGPLNLQEHGGQVRFRNIWFVER